MENLDPLNALLKAPSKDAVDQVFNLAFYHGRNILLKTSSISEALPTQIIKKTEELLQISSSEAIQLIVCIVNILDECLFESHGPEEILNLFPAGFHKNLKQLIAVVIQKNSPTWREHLIAHQISPPKLLSSDWQVHIKTSSDSSSRISTPTVIVDLQIQEVQEQKGIMPGIRHVNFELTKETLETMLDGLGKIKDQLSSIAQ